MASIKVKIDPSTPSYSVINRQKNFDRFMDRYKQYYTTRGIRHMLYHDRKKLVLIVILAIFLLLMLFQESKGIDQPNQPTKYPQVVAEAQYLPSPQKTTN